MDSHLKLAATLTKLLDNQFKVGKYRFGLDPILGLLPGIGDLLPFFVSLYMVWIGIRLKVSIDNLGKMLANVFIDLLLGAVPIIGDVTDFVYKSNAKNLSILQKYTSQNILEGEVV